MHCCITDLHAKDVINKKNGARLGNVVDVKVDTCTGAVTALVVLGRPRVMGVFSREEHCIRWEDIEVIGDDIILVNCSFAPSPENRRRGGVENLFR
ncbi:MAG: YlmC/YmxH family sporulation protein [Oscillospiraceae bacterium]|nr:YlmC/YmxH family sporulation protein [Oscillospiraceae bacterium]